MPHFRVDDALHSHPKAQRAGDDAIGMWVRAGSYCMAYLTDGFVPEWWVKQQKNGMKKARLLISSGLWTDGAIRDGEKGFQFHEFVGPGRQDSREQIEADREKWRAKKAAQRAASQGDTKGDNRQESPGDTQGESPMESRVIPNTNPTKENSLGYVPESASLSNARDAISATPGADLVRELIPTTFPDSERTMLRIKASALLREGTTREDVTDALRLWLTKPHLGAASLPVLVSEVIKARTTPTNGKPHKMRAYAELAAEVRAQEQTQLESAEHRKALE